MNPILIHKGDDTIFADVTKFLTFNIDTTLDLNGFKAQFTLAYIEKTIDDISSKSFDVVLTASDTAKLWLGEQNGKLILFDSAGNRKTISTTIPFLVTNDVVENEYQEIDLDIPESSGVDIKVSVKAGGVTSVNGMTGDVVLTAEDVGALPLDTEIPSIRGLATEQQLNEGLSTKQDKGDYALISDIPDLTDYVKNTDYATTSTAGIIKTGSDYGLDSTSTGQIHLIKATDTEIDNKNSNYKPIVPNNLDYAVKTGVTSNTYALTDDEKANAKAWLGYADNVDIMTAIASIPQFAISIVEALPETGEKMVLYLVSKNGESPDVYDEYIWIEETSSFEFLGTTAVDLTDYVKNTDYASYTKAGVFKTENGVTVTAKGIIAGTTISLENYKDRASYLIISKGTLENIKNDFVKRAVTENDIELTDDEKTSARTWLGAVGDTDYANSNNGGVLKITNQYSTVISSSGYLTGSTITLDNYDTANVRAFISKGTLDNVLAQYSKTVSLTEDDYNALETKDANTLYLIEEE